MAVPQMKPGVSWLNRTPSPERGMGALAVRGKTRLLHGGTLSLIEVAGCSAQSFEGAAQPHTMHSPIGAALERCAVLRIP